MFDLFRFITVRPPQELEKSRSIPSDTHSDFQGRLLGSSGRAQQRSVALEFIRSPRFARGWSDLHHGEALAAAWAKLRAVPDPTPAEATAILTALFDLPPKELRERETFRTDRERAADSLVAAKVISRGNVARLPELVAAIRLADLVERLARADAALQAAGAVREGLARRIRLPEGAGLGPDRPSARTKPSPAAPQTDPRAQELRDRLEAIDQAIRVLAAIPVEDYAPVPPRCEPPVSAAQVRDEVLLRLRDAVPGAAAPPAAAEAVPLGQAGAVEAEPAVSPLALSSQAVERLPEHVKAVLRDRRLDLQRIALPRAVATLESDLDATGRELARMETSRSSMVARVGSSFLTRPTAGAFLGGTHAAGPAPAASLGSLRPSGTADLLVVKQQIKRYEAGEVGHIENVLKGEANEHTVRRARTTEDTTVQETERTQEEERDLQSTEHFELKSEVERTVKEDASLKAGASLSGSYGGMIDFKTYVDGSLSTSTEEATKQSSAYAKDVTSRAATKITERVRQQITRKTIEEFEETTKHSVQNATGTGHVIGVYQWVDKVYEAQVWNYGVRLLFDLMVPEPATFFIEALADQKAEGESLEKPLPFTLNPSQLTETNYQIYVARYGATGVTAPPPLYKTVAKTFDERSDNPEPKTKAAELTLEAGYRAVTGVALVRFAWRDNKNVNWAGSPALTCLMGDRQFGGGVTALGNEEGQIAVGLFGYRVSDFTVTFEVTTRRTDVHLDDWKIKTHAAIQQAYLKAVSDYEQKLANLKAQTAGIQGHNPARNRAIEKNELKRSALALFTQRAYELFDGIDETSPGTGQPDLATADALGRYVRFFEQAFEWEQIMYVFYPYFWGRTSTWQQRLLLDDADPQFADFLQSGWARVTIPVRPWFETAVAHYLETGEIWDGGDVPEINDPLYVSILTEVGERLQRPGLEVAQGDPWEVRLPTTLVRLRPDAELPRWQKQADGTWVPGN